MSESSSEILERLVSIGIVSEEIARDVGPEADLAEPRAFVDSLAKRGTLTAYQAHAALTGSSPLVLGEYVLIDRLGKGGMGVVYKARHRRMHRLAAVKVLSPNLVGTPEGEQRFYREVRAIARLDHPNIAHAYDASEDHGVHYLVMELVEGRDFASLVTESGPLPLGDSLDAVRQAAEALACAHEAGIIHRDVKPANLLRSTDGRVKLLDLGIARLREPGAAGTETLTQTGWILGSVPYMAPEHAEDPRAADTRSDVFSLGCTLHVLLTGRLPFDGTTTVKQILAAREQPTPDLREILPKPARGGALLDDVQALFARMVAKRPEQRIATMREVADEAAAILQRAPQEVLVLKAEPPAPEPLGPPASSKPPMPKGSHHETMTAADADATHRMSRPSGSAARAPASKPGPVSPPAPPPRRAPAPRPSMPAPSVATPRRGPSLGWIALALLLIAAAVVVTWKLTRPSEVATGPAPATATALVAMPTAPPPTVAAVATTDVTPARPPAQRPPRPPTMPSVNLLADLAPRQLDGWERTPGGGVATKGHRIATLTVGYAPTPGYVLTAAFDQTPTRPDVLGSALRIQFIQGSGTVRVVELDRVLTDGRVMSRIATPSSLSSEDATAGGALHAGPVLTPGGPHSLDIEVHADAVLVTVDDVLVLQDGQPGMRPPSGPPTRLMGNLTVVTSSPTTLSTLEFAAFRPRDGEMPQGPQGGPPPPPPDGGGGGGEMRGGDRPQRLPR